MLRISSSFDIGFFFLSFALSWLASLCLDLGKLSDLGLFFVPGFRPLFLYGLPAKGLTLVDPWLLASAESGPSVKMVSSKIESSTSSSTSMF